MIFQMFPKTPWFQFTRPQGARLFAIVFRRDGTRFNSRAHKGRDLAATPHGATAEVSIHAPTRGATDPPREEVLAHQVSIHAPTRGATG